MSTFLDDWKREQLARAKAASDYYFQDHPDSPIPDADYRYPECPICHEETTVDDTMFVCNICKVRWSIDLGGTGVHGERIDPSEYE